MGIESLVTDTLRLISRTPTVVEKKRKPQLPKLRGRGRAPDKNDLCTTIKICCLGYFSIRRAGAVPINIRMNTRPGALLLLLIASGPNGIDKRQAESLLWPDSNGSGAHGLLDSTLYRLRQLLQTDAACGVEHGAIMLNSSVVSIDAWLFDSEVDGLLARLRRHPEDLEAGEVAIRSERLLELYAGPFLALETTLPWVIQTRDRLHAKFVHAIREVGNYWQAAGRWDRAAKIYEQVLERDNLAEEIYRELIRCHLVRREYAEAICIFNRCLVMLTMVLGVGPNEETEALYKQALHAQEGGREV